MKLVSYRKSDGAIAWGAVVGEESTPGIVDLGVRFPGIAGVKELLVAGAQDLERVRELLKDARPDMPLASVALLAPIIAPEKIFCIGVNYANRNEEYRDGSEAPKFPSVFTRTPGSLVGHGAAILLPPESDQLDYEGEIGIVIGRAGRRIPEEDATAHIAGLTCINEGTLRDWTKHGKFNVTQGKNFDASGSIGPWLAISDDATRYDQLRVMTRVNGELRQDDVTSNLMFSFAYLISYLSRFTTLCVGDIIATGTPTGAGIRFEPPRYLKPGDLVEVEVPGVGTLANVVERE